MADRGRPIPIGAAIYASAHKAVQPPDDRTYSAEVTVFQRNLPHHRSARAVFPYTRSNIIPPQGPIVKENFRENHKIRMFFSCNLQAGRQGRQPMRYERWVIDEHPLGLLGISPAQSSQGDNAGRQGRQPMRHEPEWSANSLWACSVSLPLNHRRVTMRVGRAGSQCVTDAG